jgi:hypothetical protein
MGGRMMPGKMMPGKMPPGTMAPGKMMPAPVTGITTGAPAPGTRVAAAVGASVPGGASVGTGVGVGVAAAAHVGVVMVSVAVETVPANAKALPVQVTVLPIVIHEASMSVPVNDEVAASVVAAVGVQNTSQADAPPANLTAEPVTVVRAPFTLKMYVPPPVRVIPAVPMDAALVAVVQ